MLWWNIFTVLDVLLLLIYNQLSNHLGPKTVFYINNVIWFLGLDIYHLYFTLALWTRDVPSIKEVPRRIVFYPMKPTSLEPRRPKLENIDTSNVCGTQDQNPNMIEETYSCDETCELQNHPIDNPGWKGKAGGRGGSRKEDFWARTKQQQDQIKRSRIVLQRPDPPMIYSEEGKTLDKTKQDQEEQKKRSKIVLLEPTSHIYSSGHWRHLSQRFQIKELNSARNHLKYFLT